MGAMEDFAKKLDKAIGLGRSTPDEEIVYLDTGYEPLNEIISGLYDGGIPAGKMVEISGPSQVGKSAIATNLLVAAQKQGGVAALVDWEYAFSQDFAEQLGLNVSPGWWNYIEGETWEEGNTRAMRLGQMLREEKIIPPEAPIVCVLDSVASAIPQSVLYDSKGKRREIDSLTMNDTTALARVTSATLKTIKAHAEHYKVTMIYINQLRTKPGVMYGDPTYTSGGSALEFYPDIRLRLTREKLTEGSGSDKEFVGQKITAKAYKTRNTSPFRTCDLRLMFDGEVARFDYTTSLIEHVRDMGKFERKGNDVVWNGKGYSAKELAKIADADPAELAKIKALLTA